MKCAVVVEVWIEVEAEDQEKACSVGVALLGEGLRLIEKKGGHWATLEPDTVEDEVPWGA